MNSNIYVTREILGKPRFLLLLGSLLMSLILLASLASCGQKGVLYLPDDAQNRSDQPPKKADKNTSKQPK